MKTIEFFQERIDELLQDKSYYQGELMNIKPDQKNPAWAMMQKRSFEKLIKECEINILHYNQGIIAVKNIQLETA